MTNGTGEPPWRIRARRSGHPPPEVDGRLRLRAEGEWLLSGPPDVVADVVRALPAHAERITEGSAILAFGNSVGHLALPHVGPVEVVSGKWGEEAFDRMLADLVRIAGNLPFSAGEAPLLPSVAKPGARRPVPYHQFLYLRHVLSPEAPRDRRLLPALELVLRDPHRRWERTTRRVHFERLGSVDPDTVASIVAGPLHRAAESAVRAGSGVARLAERLGGRLPSTAMQSRVRSEVDTPENRFVARFLDDAWRVVAEVGRATAGRTDAFGRRLAADAERCAELLDRPRRAPLWREVGVLHHLPVGSTVLRSRRGYRDVFTHWVRLRRITEFPLSPEDSTSLVEAKDIALLYELWCFFRVVEAAEAVLGPPERAGTISFSAWEAHVPNEFEVRWRKVRIVYNGRFSRGRRGLRRAYSTPLRPDIVLEDRRGPRPALHLLDAKFRVRPWQRNGRTVLRFKAADLHKMHAYRDAILAARSAWVLYPGEVEAAFMVPREQGTSVKDGGVGAIPMDPVADEDRLRGWFRSMLNEGSDDRLRSGAMLPSPSSHGENS